MEEILKQLEEINDRLDKLEFYAGIIHVDNKYKLTGEQIEELKNKWEKYKKRKIDYD